LLLLGFLTRQNTIDTVECGYYCGYDSLGQVTNACKYFSDNTPVAGQQFDYTFDSIGNRTQTMAGGDATGTNDLRTASYTNNPLNQITSRDVTGYVNVTGASILPSAVTVNGQTAYRKQEYFWQQLPVNNTNTALWTNITVSGGLTVTGNVYVAKEPEIFSYDVDGNLTNDGRWAYSWDGENRLKSMTVNTNVGPQYQLTFGYDYQGRRIQKIVATNGTSIYTNKFLYDGWNLVAETAPNNSLIRSYVWGSDLSGSPQGAGGVGGLLETTYYGISTTNCFLAYDGNGNVAALINAADGTITANYEYGAFGEPIRMTGAMAKNNPFRFSTKYDDDESDLLYYGYRYYKPSTGTWPNKDPLEEKGGMDLYGFCENNPITLIDRDGRLYYTHPNGFSTQCGGYYYLFDLYLSNYTPQQGVVVQYVDVVEDWYWCCHLHHHHKEYKFWEFMGQVIKGAQADSGISTDQSVFLPGVKGTYGSQTVTTVAKFYFLSTTGLGPYLWGQAVSYSNQSTTTQPSYWNNSPDNGEPSTGRTVMSAWNCCPSVGPITSNVITDP
jgi:RHS repeat-associated protein